MNLDNKRELVINEGFKEFTQTIFEDLRELYRKELKRDRY